MIKFHGPRPRVWTGAATDRRSAPPQIKLCTAKDKVIYRKILTRRYGASEDNACYDNFISKINVISAGADLRSQVCSARRRAVRNSRSPTPLHLPLLHHTPLAPTPLHLPLLTQTTPRPPTATPTEHLEEFVLRSSSVPWRVAVGGVRSEAAWPCSAVLRLFVIAGHRH